MRISLVQSIAGALERSVRHGFSRRCYSRFAGTVCLILLCSTLFAQDRVRISDTDGKRAVVNRVDPAYPPMAKQMKISGHVEVDVEVDTEGQVDKVDVVSGNTLLAGACVSAVKKWKFTPFMAGGKAAPAVVRLGFNFSL